MVIGIRQRIVEDTDGQSSKPIDVDDDDEVDNSDRLLRDRPSAEAREKFTDYSKHIQTMRSVLFTGSNFAVIPYVSDEHADAATKNSELKLVFRLLNFAVLDDGASFVHLLLIVVNRSVADADELEWYVPAAIVPSDLQRSLDVITQFTESPIDLGDQKASQMLVKKRRRRRVVRRAQSGSEDEDVEEDQPRRRKRKEKKKRNR